MQVFGLRRGPFFWLAVAAVFVATPAARAADLTPFKIGISAPVVTIFPVWMAQAAGLDAKEGLKVESITMEGGSRGVQVLLSGEIQAMHVGLAPVVQANKQGADLRLVTSTANTIPITIFTSPAIKIRAGPQGQDHRHQHVRLGNRCRHQHRAATARSQAARMSPFRRSAARRSASAR